MNKRIALAALLVAYVAADASAQNRTHRRRGAVLGGLAGAAIGVAIGDKGNNETAGALIGGAVGAIAGGAIGDAKDKRIEHDMRYHSGYPGYNPSSYPAYGQPHGGYSYDGHYHTQYRPSYYDPQLQNHYPPPRPPLMIPAEAAPTAVSAQDVVAMVRSGMSESMIIQQIQIRGVQHQLSVSEVIGLHQQGVSEPIINAFQGVFPTVSDEPRYPQPGQSYRVPMSHSDPYGSSILAPANGR